MFWSPTSFLRCTNIKWEGKVYSLLRGTQELDRDALWNDADEAGTGGSAEELYHPHE